MKKRRTRIMVALASVVVIIVIAGVGLWQYHEQPQFCGNTCHIMKPYLESWQSSTFSAHAHAEKGVTCLDCHEPTLEQQTEELIRYVKGDYKNPLRQRKFKKEWCLRCHDHGSYPEIIERTKNMEPNPHNSHYGELDCRVCHRMHQSSELYCAHCMEQTKVKVPEGWIASTAQ